MNVVAVENLTGPWSIIVIGRDSHIIPVGDTRMHTFPQLCWCRPDTQRLYSGCRMYSHNALDGRN